MHKRLLQGLWWILLFVGVVLGWLGGPSAAQQGGGGSPLAPEITFIDFPAQIPSDGSKVFGRVGFSDRNGDINLARFEVVSATDFAPFSFNPQLKGSTEGVFEFFVFSQIAQQVTLRVTLTDEAGNASQPTLFSFAAVSLIKLVTAWGGLGSGAGQFMGISGLALAPQGNVYVTDAENDRVQITLTASAATYTISGSLKVVILISTTGSGPPPMAARSRSWGLELLTASTIPSRLSPLLRTR